MSSWGILRVLHVLLGVFWAGSMFFFVLFLEPSLRASGPAGGTVMQAIVRRRFLQTLITVGAFTLVSGFFVLWRQTSGFSSGWLAAGYSHSILGGATTGLATLAIGVFVSRPTLQALVKKGAAVAASGAPPTDADAAEIARLQGRLRVAARAAAALLLVTILLMAAAREL